MPISISGSGTITGINTGGLPDGCIATADLADNAVTYAKIGTTEQGQLCKAWVNFNGTTASPSTIRGSGNVSSVTKNGTGDYTVNFTTAMVDANYTWTTGVSEFSNADRRYFLSQKQATAAPATTSCRFQGVDTGNLASDLPYLNIAIFR